MIYSLSKSADSEALLKFLCQSSPNVFHIEVAFDLPPVFGSSNVRRRRPTCGIRVALNRMHVPGVSNDVRVPAGHLARQHFEFR